MESKLIIFDLDDTLINTFETMGRGSEWEDIKNLSLIDGAREFLANVKARKILVTTESVDGLQKVKMDNVGISNDFEEVVVCDSHEAKRRCFAEIDKKNFGVEIWAIGDRIDSEIRHANALGWKSVRLKRGKYVGLAPKCELEIPKYEIRNFAELENLL